MTINKNTKDRIAVNVFSNITFVIINSLFILFLTPYLIRKLGIELYGLIPLAISFIAYFNLLTMSVANSVNRYVTLNYHNGEYERSNTYFNSAFWSLLVLCLVLLGPAVLVAINFSELLTVPNGYENDVGLLFLLIISGALLTSISSPFMVGIFIKHRFDLDSLVKISSKLIQLLIIVILFEYVAVNIVDFGVSYFLVSVFSLAIYYFLSKNLTPELEITISSFEFDALKEMSKMSMWGVLTQVGSIMYLTITFVMVNLLLGVAEAGKYAAIAQWITLLTVLGGAIANVFSPIAYEYIAKKDINSLSKQVGRSIKFITLLMGFPVALLCGFSGSILGIWLGKDFESLSGLMILLVAPWLITVGIRPMFAIFLGMNKVKLPAFVTILFGIVNITLIYVLIVYMGMGLYGVAISLLFSIVGKNLIFIPIYTAMITKQSNFRYVIAMVPGFVMAGFIAIASTIINSRYNIDNMFHLVVAGTLASFVYYAAVFVIFINKEEKRLLYELIRKKSQ